MLSFSEKQTQYLQLLAKGMSDRQIAKYMRVRLETIQNGYRHVVADKLKLFSKQELVTYAKQHGYGKPEEEDK